MPLSLCIKNKDLYTPTPDKDKEYIEYYKNPAHEKYKTPGTRFLEIGNQNSQIGINAVVDIILRNPESIGKLIKDHLDFLNSKILPKEFRKTVDEILKQYEKYKDDAGIKTLMGQGEEMSLSYELIILNEEKDIPPILGDNDQDMDYSG